MSTSVAELRIKRRLAAVSSEMRYRQVREDFELFCETAVLIERKDAPSGYGPFELLDHQRELARELLTSRRIINLKARQLGISTEVMAFLLWRALSQPGFKALVLSHKDEYAKATLERLRLMFLQLPAWLRERLPEPNDASGNFTLDYGNGIKSVITSMPVTKKVGASMTLDCVFFDEAGLAEYAGDAYASLAPTLDAAMRNDRWKGAVIIVASTARGGTNWFAQTWRRDRSFTKVFFPWTASPYYDQGDYDRDLAAKRASGEEHLHYQERPANPEEAFRKSGAGRFPMAPKPEDCAAFGLRGRIRTTEAGALEFEPNKAGNLYVAELPDRSKPYVIGVDVAHGKLQDYTVATVMAYDDDGLPYVAAYWRSNEIEPYTAAHEFELLGKFYGGQKPALLAIEKQGGHGDTFITVLRSLNYRNLYRFTPTTTVARKPRAEYGFPMDRGAKPRVMDNLAQMLPSIGNVSYDLALELAAFVIKDNGKQEADDGAHDDLVDSLAIACWLLSQARRSANGAPAAAIGEDAPDSDPTVTAERASLQKLYTDAARVRSSQSRQDRKAMAAYRRTTRRR